MFHELQTLFSKVDGDGDKETSKSAAAIFVLLVFAVCFAAWHWLAVRPSRLLSGQKGMAPSCPNPNCIRCQRYRQVQSNARSRMPWVVRGIRQSYPNVSLDRICDSIQHPQRHITRTQNPTVLMVRDLVSQEVVTDMHKRSIGPYISDFPLDEILSEVARLDQGLWNRNDTSAGTWEVLPLLNQGQWNETIACQCPHLLETVKGMHNLLDRSLFGNAMVSKIYEGSIIEPHCGPTNVRHRLQYAMYVANQSVIMDDTTGPKSVSQQPYLQVGKHGVRLSWRKPGDWFVFDDSFVHSVHYNNRSDHMMPSSDSTTNSMARVQSFRMVLIVDLWHPDLSPGERTVLQNMYPPSFQRRHPQRHHAAPHPVEDSKLKKED